MDLVVVGEKPPSRPGVSCGYDIFNLKVSKQTPARRILSGPCNLRKDGKRKFKTGLKVSEFSVRGQVERAIHPRVPLLQASRRVNPGRLYDDSDVREPASHQVFVRPIPIVVDAEARGYVRELQDHDAVKFRCGFRAAYDRPSLIWIGTARR